MACQHAVLSQVNLVHTHRLFIYVLILCSHLRLYVRRWKNIIKMNRGEIPLLHSVQTSTGPTQPSIQWVSGALLPKGNLPGPPLSVGAKKKKLPVTLKKQDMKVRTGLIWLRITSSGGRL
jgi:hypothetical protein